MCVAVYYDKVPSPSRYIFQFLFIYFPGHVMPWHLGVLTTYYSYVVAVNAGPL